MTERTPTSAAWDRGSLIGLPIGDELARGGRRLSDGTWQRIYAGSTWLRYDAIRVISTVEDGERDDDPTIIAPHYHVSVSQVVLVRGALAATTPSLAALMIVQRDFGLIGSRVAWPAGGHVAAQMWTPVQ